MIKICDDPETGCDYECLNCEIPEYEPEWCYVCSEKAEKAGIEYEFLVTHKTGSWTCENCRRGC